MIHFTFFFPIHRIIVFKFQLSPHVEDYIDDGTYIVWSKSTLFPYIPSLFP